MKHWKIILNSFLIGCFSVVVGLLLMHTPQSQAYTALSC